MTKRRRTTTDGREDDEERRWARERADRVYAREERRRFGRGRTKKKKLKRPKDSLVYDRARGITVKGGPRITAMGIKKRRRDAVARDF